VVEPPCGLNTMRESAVATYLPLARAAHVQGVVVMIAEFGTDGAVTKIRVLNGPEMLQSGAVDFVKSWRANTYTGPRTCPVVVTYTLGSSSQTSGKRIDPQHYTVVGAEPPCLCDPSGEVGRKRKRFLFF
jgi:hypothetical protein